jgi:hypothetical protein
MSAQNKSAMWKFFSAIDNPTQASTAMCATVFDELDAALSLLNSARTATLSESARLCKARCWCAQFMRGHGINTDPAATSSVLLLC